MKKSEKKLLKALSIVTPFSFEDICIFWESNDISVDDLYFVARKATSLGVELETANYIMLNGSLNSEQLKTGDILKDTINISIPIEMKEIIESIIVNRKDLILEQVALSKKPTNYLITNYVSGEVSGIKNTLTWVDNVSN